MEKVAGHTPEPWFQSANIILGPHGETIVTARRGTSFDIKANDFAESNAAFIVQAVNSHDELVAALKAIINSDMAMREEDEGNRSAVLDAARAALSRATKQEG